MRRKLLFVLPILLIVGSASTVVAADFYPPFKHTFEFCFPWVENDYHYVDCYPSDTDVTYADMYIGFQVEYQSIQIVVGKQFTYSSTVVRAVHTDVRIKGYLASEYWLSGAYLAVQCAIAKYQGGLEPWVAVYNWVAYSYEIDGAGSKSWNLETIHYRSTYVTLSPGTYRLCAGVWVYHNGIGWFSYSSQALYSPARVYFDVIGYYIGH